MISKFKAVGYIAGGDEPIVFSGAYISGTELLYACCSTDPLFGPAEFLIRTFKEVTDLLVSFSKLAHCRTDERNTLDLVLDYPVDVNERFYDQFRNTFFDVVTVRLEDHADWIEPIPGGFRRKEFKVSDRTDEYDAIVSAINNCACSLFAPQNMFDNELKGFGGCSFEDPVAAINDARIRLLINESHMKGS